MIFWDSSAIIALLVSESYTAEVRDVLRADDEILVWWGTPLECHAAVARRERSADLTPEHVDQVRRELEALRGSWTEVAPAERVRSRAEALVRRHPLRAADALQLSAAISWAGEQPDGRTFCVIDRRLAGAARAEGFALALE